MTHARTIAGVISRAMRRFAARSKRLCPDPVACSARLDKLRCSAFLKRRSITSGGAKRGATGSEGEFIMAQATSRLYVPAFGAIYVAFHDYADAILRIVLGGVLIPHGCQKLFGLFGGTGFSGNAALFDRIGFTPGIFWGTLVGCTELIGGALLVLGLFTRFAAAAVLIFMLVAMKVTSARGFFWSNGGMEYSLLIGACALFFLIRGGGDYALDRAIGREI